MSHSSYYINHIFVSCLLSGKIMYWYFTINFLCRVISGNAWNLTDELTHLCCATHVEKLCVGKSNYARFQAYMSSPVSWVKVGLLASCLRYIASRVYWWLFTVYPQLLHFSTFWRSFSWNSFRWYTILFGAVHLYIDYVDMFYIWSAKFGAQIFTARPSSNT